MAIGRDDPDLRAYGLACSSRSELAWSTVHPFATNLSRVASLGLSAASNDWASFRAALLQELKLIGSSM